MPEGGVLARFYRPGGGGFELLSCPGGGEFAHQKKLPGVLPGGMVRLGIDWYIIEIKACDSGDQAVLQWSYMGRVQILHRGSGGGICTCHFRWKRKEQSFSKVDAKIYCSISKVSQPEKGLAFQFLVWPGRGSVECPSICNLIIWIPITMKFGIMVTFFKD